MAGVSSSESTARFVLLDPHGTCDISEVVALLAPRHPSWRIVREGMTSEDLPALLLGSGTQRTELGLADVTVASKLQGVKDLTGKVANAILMQDYQGVFVPTTYVLYAEEAKKSFNEESFARIAGLKSAPDLIFKPNFAGPGQGIQLITGSDMPTKVSRLRSCLKNMHLHSASDSAVVQHYVSNPMLLFGHKWDIRAYALILDVGGSRRVFVLREGLVRVCPEAYSEGSESASRNLSNMSLSRTSAARRKHVFTNDVTDGARGLRRTLSAVLEALYAGEADAVGQRIRRVAGLAARAIADRLPPEQGFQILGLDIMLDDHAQPWLLEVNSRPTKQTEHVHVPDLAEECDPKGAASSLSAVEFDQQRGRVLDVRRHFTPKPFERLPAAGCTGSPLDDRAADAADLLQRRVATMSEKAKRQMSHWCECPRLGHCPHVHLPCANFMLPMAAAVEGALVMVERLVGGHDVENDHALCGGTRYEPAAF